MKFSFINDFLIDEKEELLNVVKFGNFISLKDSGFSLKYSRNEFLRDLSKEYQTNKNKTIFFKQLNITPIFSNENLTGYDGFLNIEKLNQKTYVYKICNKFLNQNKIETENDILTILLNSLIEEIPEFVNIMGKCQHRPQTLDIHTFLVLQNILNDDEYINLDVEDKTFLKTMAILHDISKREFIVDKSHPQSCADKAKEILKKVPLDEKLKSKVYFAIKNHHWLEYYNKNEISAKDCAQLFKDKHTLKLFQMISDADLKGVDEIFYNMYKDALASDKQDAILAEF